MAGISAEGEHSSMVEDAPATTEHGRRRRVMGTVRGAGSGRGICLRNSLSISSMSSMPYDRVVIRCPSMRPISWSCLGMLHI
jgi:metal-dependent HD superfamily phosphatase/phosphodiesterase